MMALGFPNKTRSYDENGDCVRFVGHDGHFAISFSIAVAALKAKSQTEDGYLRAFDSAAERIRSVAVKVYAKTRKNHYRLVAADL